MIAYALTALTLSLTIWIGASAILQVKFQIGTLLSFIHLKILL